MLINGFLMGIAAIIPGVSSGTVAVLLKFYDRLIESVDHIIRFKRQYFVSSLIFVILIYGGNFIALFTLAGPMELLLLEYPNHMSLLFMGLLIGSIPLIIKKVHEKELKPFKHIGLVLAFSVSVLSLVLLNIFTPDQSVAEPITTLTLSNTFLIFITGFVASATAIIPGISGSMVQLAIGMYPTFVNALAVINIPILMVLFGGMLLGLIVAARGIAYLLKHYYHLTYMIILGLLIGSIVQILPNFDASISILEGLSYGLALLIGFILAFGSNAFDKKKNEIKLVKKGE
jgi:putative membrane protein